MLCDSKLKRPGTRFSEVPGNLLGPISIFFNVFFADYTVITAMVLSQCFHIIIRFSNLVFKGNKN